MLKSAQIERCENRPGENPNQKPTGPAQTDPPNDQCFAQAARGKDRKTSCCHGAYDIKISVNKPTCSADFIKWYGQKDRKTEKEGDQRPEFRMTMHRKNSAL